MFCLAYIVSSFSQIIKPPGIYTEGYIVFIFPFVRLYVNWLVCSYYLLLHIGK